MSGVTIQDVFNVDPLAPSGSNVVYESPNLHTGLEAKPTSGLYANYYAPGYGPDAKALYTSSDSSKAGFYTFKIICATCPYYKQVRKQDPVTGKVYFEPVLTYPPPGGWPDGQMYEFSAVDLNTPVGKRQFEQGKVVYMEALPNNHVEGASTLYSDDAFKASGIGLTRGGGINGMRMINPSTIQSITSNPNDPLYQTMIDWTGGMIRAEYAANMPPSPFGTYAASRQPHQQQLQYRNPEQLGPGFTQRGVTNLATGLSALRTTQNTYDPAAISNRPIPPPRNEGGGTLEDMLRNLSRVSGSFGPGFQQPPSNNGNSGLRPTVGQPYENRGLSPSQNDPNMPQSWRVR